MSKNMNHLDKCMLCPHISSGSSDKSTCSIGKKGLESLISASEKRQDDLQNELKRILEEMHQDVTRTLQLHKVCRRYYVEQKRINRKRLSSEVSSSLETSPAKVRSIHTKFNIKQDCVYCGCSHELIKKKYKREKLSDIKTLPYLNRLNKKIAERNDEWAHQVFGRINTYYDLVAPEGKYHRSCMQSFYMGRANPSQPSLETSTVGRKPDERLNDSFLKLCEYLEANDECQYSMQELKNVMEGFQTNGDPTFTTKWLKHKLESHYDDQIIITAVSGKADTVSFKDFSHKVLRQQWEHDKSDLASNKEQIIDRAAAYILDDIRTTVFDNSSYPSFVNTEEIDNMIPSLLLRFLQGILRSKAKDQKVINRRISAIAHSLISAARPRSFVSPLLLSIAVYIHQNFASKQMITILNSLSFSENYNELQRLHLAMSAEEVPAYDLTGFTQFIFDNADFNIATLTGHGTFHALGGLACVTPAGTPIQPQLKRSLKIQSCQNTRKSGTIPIQRYTKRAKVGLGTITLSPLELEDATIGALKKATTLDFLWLASFGRQLSTPVPSWNGFMQVAVKGKDFQCSGIKILPFINMNPNDMSTIYSALCFAQKLCDKYNLSVGPVTFDQPLYIKAADIIAACPGQFKSLFARLGGFHWLMSAMGSIGYIMSGSGLEELFETVYAPGTVSHMISGHAYTRAFRGHLLASSAVLSILLQDGKILLQGHEEVVTNLLCGNSDTDEVQNCEAMHSLMETLSSLIKEKDCDTRTVKLWKSYLNFTHLLRLFVFAERTGDFALHLYCMEHFIPVFHAAGHLAYAKSSRLYVQQMKALKNKIPKEGYILYTEKGYFTIRRKDCYFGGNSTDLVIEQDLMRLFKASGGMTRGRGITESTIAWFVDILPQCIPICHYLENISGISSSSSEQHKDLRPSHLAQDLKDLNTFTDWLKAHSPYSFTDSKSLVSLGTGVTADSTVNCDHAYTIGKTAADAITGQVFTAIQLHRKDKIVSFSSIRNTVRVRGQDAVIDPNILWHRLLLSINNSQDREPFFAYELAPEPTSLFKQGMMRKTQKAAMGAILREGIESTDVCPNNAIFIIDGGYLLRKVRWPVNITYREICTEYVKYVVHHFGENCILVLDGYDDLANNTKSHEHLLRAGKVTSCELQFELDMKTVTNQEAFLANCINKSRLLTKLKPHFLTKGIQVKQAKGDADSLIVSTVIDEASKGESPVVLVGNDTDLLVMLITLANPSYNISMMVETDPVILYNISEIQGKYSRSHRDLFLFLHCFSGCDTTSALYNKGKKTIFNWFIQLKPEMLEELKVFTENNSRPDDIACVGERFIARLYGAKKDTGVDRLRYLAYNRSIGKSQLSTSFKLESLPPTSAALKQHSYRVYHAVQQAMCHSLPATDWGWMKKESLLMPVLTEKPAAPETLLKLVSCGCKVGCQKNCSCRKLGLHCTMICSGCNGQTCSNIPQPYDDNMDSE